jgi:ribA/ribD-fused uncharacterized protein
MKLINVKQFKNVYKKYSNFYPVKVMFEGVTYPSVEHAFQAAKTKNKYLRLQISKIPSNQAGKVKAAGRRLKIRKDWDTIKISVMRYLLTQKFNQDEFKNLLLSVNGQIIEGNYWCDNYWGDCYCPKCQDIEGKNILGKLIMNIRDEIL